MRFDIIPVIDLKDGRAVRAVGGNRADYRSLETPLCPDGDPVTAARRLLGLCASSVLYIADLDAIEGRAPQHEVIRQIAGAVTGVELWVDDGATGPADIDASPLRDIARTVLGSESLGADIPAIDHRVALSLDFRGERFLGPPALLTQAHLWPRDVIVMCLHSVGASGGPDLARLARVIEAAGQRHVYAAGGVRDIADIETLADLGVAGALISSALHSGAISQAEIRAFTQAQM
jgi:HisA/HisF family protein